MRLSSWLGLGLGLFYVIAAFGYALTSEFVDAFPLLIVAGLGAGTLGTYVYLAVRRGERELAGGAAARDEVEPHVGPTIWPFGYAGAAVFVVIAFKAYHPLYMIAGLLFVASSAGWFADVRDQWRHSHEQPPEPGPPLGPDTTPMADEGIL